MNYIILDLEWNNAYSKRQKCFVNEIIEIGAVMLDEQLNTVDTFSVFVKAQLGKKLHSRVKELTNITNEDISGGTPFSQAMSSFRKWSEGQNNVVVTWGDTDLRVLIDNFHYFNGIRFIPFLKNYLNLQRYAQAFLNVTNSEQLGLSAAAQLLEIDLSEYSMHRASDDSIVTVEVFRRVFNQKMLKSYISACDDVFYNRLLFRAKAVTNINSPLIDKNEMVCVCDKCGRIAEQIEDWRLIAQSFRGIFYCSHCDRKMRFTVRFREYYDRVDVRSSTVPFIEKKEPQLNTDSGGNIDAASE